ncbi:F0F1 ATP synthase subunit delta [Puniceicoccales bacterium CK1056]|uniref:F0F1 ATP synthase subunit delta n=1 Tax=Oceanipulchritudo coccoides TaxID=2706888 RepID=A0A6B2M208_9BACT|nr:F0F1 ATP synthase subunit delta [Oceanipulchritudo coccoides]NDV62174.1 F0F1 ATP synthase subunit delta [Oceanipulchritudo coccoides]
MLNPRDIKLSKKLAQLVVEAGEAGIPEIKPAIEAILVGRSAADRKAFLKSFLKAATREIHKVTLTVESAAVLSQDVLDQLVAHFNEGRARPLEVIRKTNPSLIAGMRVRLGDSVYDASLSHNLQTLASRIR